MTVPARSEPAGTDAEALIQRAFAGIGNTDPTAVIFATAALSDLAREVGRLQGERERLREAITEASRRTQQPVDLNYIAIFKDDWERIAALAATEREVAAWGGSGVSYDATHLILGDVADSYCTRDDVAASYALGLRTTADWHRVNDAISRRWSISALDYIKRKAWKRLETAPALPREEEE